MMGLKDSQIVQYGLPIRPAFSKPTPSRALLRRRLGLNQNLPAVLMVGGGEGMGQLEATVREIGKKGTVCQLVVVCGRNEKLQRKLEEGQWGPNVEVHAFGFVSNMHEFMNCCDAIITKAGVRHPALHRWCMLCWRAELPCNWAVFGR
jgi:1,2-diacylglycerol 3-beta-galactosyltransferase